MLFLGQEAKLSSDNKYQVEDLQAFFIPKNTMIAIYGTTMHFAPCRTKDEGFKCLVILLNKINSDFIEKPVSNDTALFKYGKWLVAHPDNKKFIDQNAYPGIVGENYELKIK